MFFAFVIILEIVGTDHIETAMVVSYDLPSKVAAGLFFEGSPGQQRKRSLFIFIPITLSNIYCLNLVYKNAISIHGTRINNEINL